MAGYNEEYYRLIAQAYHGSRNPQTH
jgi:hypothetical protein